MPVNLPLELWHQIMDEMPSLTARYAARVFKFRLRSPQRNHSRVWDNIFQNQMWLNQITSIGINPILIGKDLNVLYHNNKKIESMDLTLIVYLDTQTKSKLGLSDSIFLDSLRPHKVNKKTGEIKFESGITLNASHVLLEQHTWDSKKKLLLFV